MPDVGSTPSIVAIGNVRGVRPAPLEAGETNGFLAFAAKAGHLGAHLDQRPLDRFGEGIRMRTDELDTELLEIGILIIDVVLDRRTNLHELQPRSSACSRSESTQSSKP